MEQKKFTELLEPVGYLKRRYVGNSKLDPDAFEEMKFVAVHQPKSCQDCGQEVVDRRVHYEAVKQKNKTFWEKKCLICRNKFRV